MTATDPPAEAEAAFLSGDRWRDPLQHLILCDFLEERCGRPREAALRRVLVEPGEDRHRLDFAEMLDCEPSPCPHCGGDGRQLVFPEHDAPTCACPNCKGTGRAAESDAARAEFVRVQVELAALESACEKAGDLDRVARALTHDRRAVLRRRERELFAQSDVTRGWFGPAWEFTVAGQTWADYLQWFRRGFIARVSCTAADFMRCAAGVFAAAPIEEVTLSCRNSSPGMTGRVPSTWFANRHRDVVPAAVGSNCLPWSIAVGLGMDRAQRRVYPRFERYEWQYDDCRSADTALSTAAVAFGRAAAHLPPLPARGPAAG